MADTASGPGSAAKTALRRRVSPPPLPPHMRSSPAVPGRRAGVWRTLVGAIDDALEHRRHIILLPFAFIAGVLVYLQAEFEPVAGVASGTAAALVVAACVARWRRAVRAMRWLTLAAAMACGFALPALYGVFFGTAMLTAPTVAVIEGPVAARTRSGPDRQTLYVVLEDTDARERLAGIRLVRLSLDGAEPVLPGDRIRVRARMFEVPGPVAPDAYDPQLHDYFAGVGAYATALDPPAITRGGGGVGATVSALRQVIAERIAARLGDPAAAFATALIIGEQGGITEEDRAALARAGLAHVIAISGLHLSLVAGAVFMLLRLALAIGPPGRTLPVKTLAALASMAVALVYLMISGMSTATVRATLMLALVLGAVIAGRRALTMRNVTLAAMVVLAINPLNVLRPGFQLSFAAVVALIGCYEGLRHRPDRAPRPAAVRYFGGLVLTSLIAGLATAPFAAFHFQQFAPLGVLGNLLAVPLVGVVVLPAGLLAVMAMPLGLEGLPLDAMGWGIERVLAIAYWVSGLSGTLTVTPELHPAALGFVTAGLCWFAFLGTRLRFAGPVLALVLAVTVGWRDAPDVIVSDSSQAVAIRTDAGLRLVGSNRTSFAVRAWSERYGTPLDSLEATGTCDDYGCVASGVGGWSLAVDRTFAVAAEDCGAVAVMVARGGVPPACAAWGEVITPADLRRRGVHVLTRDGSNGFSLRTGFDDINRPWRAGRRD